VIGLVALTDPLLIYAINIFIIIIINMDNNNADHTLTIYYDAPVLSEKDRI
jgi:hypothetical protein